MAEPDTSKVHTEPNVTRLPGTNFDLAEVVKVLNPNLKVNVLQDEGFDRYTVRVSWMGYSNVQLSGQQLHHPQLVVEEVSEAVRRLETFAREQFGLSRQTDDALRYRDEQWHSRLSPILMATGIAPGTVNAILEEIKKELK